MISLVIPVKNEERVIGETLKKLKAGLTRTPHEIIVSDGKSADRTVPIAKQYADHVVVWDKDRRQTIAEGRNLGAARAKGEYLVFCDADTSIPNADEFFRKVIGIFTAHPRLTGLTVSIRVLPEYETTGDKIVFTLLNAFHAFMNNVLHAGRAAGEFQMVRRAAFEKLGGYRADLVASEDYEFFSRLSRIGETKMVSDLTIFHTGRRAHKIGWPRLLTIWFLNTLSVLFRKRAASKEWEEIR